MPELPEVEITRLGLLPHVTQQQVTAVIIRQPKLRWLVPNTLAKQLPGQCIQEISRRGKYLILRANNGSVICHLGMSGSLRIVASDVKPEKHDHVDICFANNTCLRLRDPRRFGAVLWTQDDPFTHQLLNSLGPEPLTAEFSAKQLYVLAQTHKCNVKSFIMNSKIVVGVGNIYANEALFVAGIHPCCPANEITLPGYKKLVQAIKTILQHAITAGGTTLRDFTNSEGNPGYFSLQLKVYGRDGESCERCGQVIQSLRISQRNTFYCPECQVMTFTSGLKVIPKRCLTSL